MRLLLSELPAALAGRLAADPEFTFACRHWTCVVRLLWDGSGLELKIVNGVLLACEAPGPGAADVVISAPSARWEELLATTPAPGRGLQCLSSVPAARSGPMDFSGLSVSADFERHYLPYAPALSRLLGLMREVLSGVAPADSTGRYPLRQSDTATGRYIYYDLDGVEYRVYAETAGQGATCLLLQHTAGSDGRQWRHLLADPSMQEGYRMVAYDLPYHGRSLPPPGVEWWKGAYAPTGDELRRHIVAVKDALGLDRPVFMGTSMGGQLAPELLAHHPEHFRGAVAVNGWHHMDIAVGRTQEFLDHPRVHPRSYADAMYRNTSPLAPEAYRREVAFVYASGAPGIYKGDNEYFNYGHDMRHVAHLVDTSRTPLSVVVGEYDPSAWLPGGARELVEAVPGARFVILPGMSHFAMADDPLRFNEAIRPILDDLCSAGG